MKYTEQVEELLKNIEVSESDYEKAVSRYESVSKYIVDNYIEYSPEIYLQGSFKLGTSIKPLTEDGAYDIDIICLFGKYNKQMISQAHLKEIMGKIVKGYADSYGIKEKPHDGKKCWTIQYVDNHNFHLDILPAISNWDSGNVIAYTNRKNRDYNMISDGWSISNPKDYYKWFMDIARFSEYKARFAFNENVDIEKVPDYKIKTPLQRVVQIFKRHAEVTFENNMEYKPSSVVITTLVTKAYELIGYQIKDFEELLSVLSENMIYFLDEKCGRKCVLNPVDKEENLSEKWMTNIAYYNQFKQWHMKLKEDFNFKRYYTRVYAYSVINECMNINNQKKYEDDGLALLSHHQRPK